MGIQTKKDNVADNDDMFTPVAEETVVTVDVTDVDTMLARARVLIDKGDFKTAMKTLAKLSESSPKCAEMWWLTLVADNKIDGESSLEDCVADYTNDKSYIKAMKYCEDEEQKAEWQSQVSTALASFLDKKKDDSIADGKQALADAKENKKLSAIGDTPENAASFPDGLWQNAAYIKVDSDRSRIKSDEFYNCTKLIGIVIPAAVESIGSSAFKDCTHLTTVTFAPNSKLKTLGRGAFENCGKLVDIDLPTTVIMMRTKHESDVAVLINLVRLRSMNVRNFWLGYTIASFCRCKRKVRRRMERQVKENRATLNIEDRKFNRDYY